MPLVTAAPNFRAMSNPYRYRMAIALLALVAALVALYLHLWKAGYTGTLSCTSGRGCIHSATLVANSR